MVLDTDTCNDTNYMVLDTDTCNDTNYMVLDTGTCNDTNYMVLDTDTCNDTNYMVLDTDTCNDTNYFNVLDKLHKLNLCKLYVDTYIGTDFYLLSLSMWGSLMLTPIILIQSHLVMPPL